jgi:hypothetical protein
MQTLLSAQYLGILGPTSVKKGPHKPLHISEGRAYCMEGRSAGGLLGAHLHAGMVQSRVLW